MLIERGFHEVETPVLQNQAGGAAARPVPHPPQRARPRHDLRIALELPLKRLIVGGMDRVFEIGRVFRNEGIDTRHNPEFTMLEAYQAFGDYHDMMDLTEAIVAAACEEANGHDRGRDRRPRGRPEAALAAATMAELIERDAGVQMHPSMPVAEARRDRRRLGVA